MWEHDYAKSACEIAPSNMFASVWDERTSGEPLHKSVCVGVQWIKSRRVAQMMSFWDFENSVKDLEGGHFSRRVATGTSCWGRRLGSSGQLGRASNRQCGGVKFLVAYRDGWCFSTAQVLRVRAPMGSLVFLRLTNLLVCVGATAWR